MTLPNKQRKRYAYGPGLKIEVMETEEEIITPLIYNKKQAILLANKLNIIQATLEKAHGAYGIQGE